MNEQQPTNTAIPELTQTEQPVLSSIRSLMEEAYQRLQQNFKTLVTVEVLAWIPMIIGMVLMVIFVFPYAQEAGIEQSIPFLNLSSSARTVVWITGFLILLALIVRIIVSAGQVRLLAGEDSMSGSELMHYGWSRLLPMIGNALLLLVMFIPLIAVILVLVISGTAITFLIFSGASAEVIDSAKNALYIGGAILVVLLPIYVLLLVRLSFVMTLVAIGGTTNAFKESWRLTKGLFWAILWRIAVASIAIGFVSAVLRSLIDQLIPSAGGDTSVQFIAGIIATILGIAIQAILALFGASYSVSLLRNVQKIKAFTA